MPRYDVTAEVTPVSSDQLAASVKRILDTNNLCTIATITSDGTPYASTSFFVPLGDNEVAIWTSPKAKHSLNAETNPAASLTVFNSSQPFGQPLVGLQAFGTLTRTGTAGTLRAFTQYARRFASFKALASSVDEMHRVFESRFYIFSIQTVKVLDEPSFGSENYVTGRVL